MIDTDQLRRAFPDGVVWHNFYREKETDQALVTLAKAYGVEAKDERSAYEAAKRGMIGKKALVLLDGTEETDNLKPLMEVLGSCAVIVTTRDKAQISSDYLEIEPLLEDAVTLLKLIARQFIDDEASPLEICMLIGGLPLVVCLVGKYLFVNQEPSSEYLVWLRATPLDALEQGTRKADSVSILLKRSFEFAIFGAVFGDQQRNRR